MEHMATKNNEGQRSNSPNSEGSCGCILVVTSQANPAQHVMDYVISVADRLGSKIIMASVNPRPLLRENSFLSRTPRVAVSPEADVFRAKAQSRGIAYQCIADSGKIDKVISRLCHIVKRVEFVVIDQGIRLEEVAAGSPVPVFSVAGGTQGSAWKTRGHQIRTLFHGETTMKATTRKTYLMKTLIFGAMTAALYGAVFAYQEAIMHYWTKGGIYCLLPVATVFVFSYAHGSFTSYFWSALGIEGSKASSTQQKEKHVSITETAKKRPDTRPRVQANAS